MIEIPVIKSLEPYFKIAEASAKLSPCLRRQYGAVIVHSGPEIYYTARYNSRVSLCCQGSCARTALGLVNGERVEVGAEVHAETAALIADTPDKPQYKYFIMVGFSGEQELLGGDVYPCHTCALNIYYAGFRWVYLRDEEGIIPKHIMEIIEYREKEWV